MWLMTRFINNDETASQNVADLLTTNSKASYEIVLFQNGPHLILDWITRTALSAPIYDFAINEEINDRRLSWYETDSN